MLKSNKKELNNRAISKHKRVIKNLLHSGTIKINKLVSNTRYNLDLQENAEWQFRDNVEYDKVIIFLRSRFDDEFYFFQEDGNQRYQEYLIYYNDKEY